MQYTHAIDITAPNNSNNNPKTALQISAGLTPYVRYAETGEDGEPNQLPRLHPLNEPIPYEADFVSPVYFLTDEQKEHQDKVLEWDDSGGWAVSDYSCIAEKIQNQCEQANRVRYPVYVESDAEVPFHVMRKGMNRFIREILEVDPYHGRWYFSGGSSLHAHLPFYIRNNTELQRLRQEAKEFNKKAEVTVDESNYSKKSLIRLPGAIHDNTGCEKFPVSSDSPDKNLLKRIAQVVDDSLPDNERDLISYTAGSTDIVRFSISQELGLIKEISTPLKEQQNRPIDPADLELWKRYNRYPFSPYANTGNKRRSFLIARVKGNPFCRDDEPAPNDPDQEIEKGIFVPAFIYGAVGADGNYAMWGENGRFRLSKPDYQKWDYSQGDTIVLLGGQSRDSCILELEGATDRELVCNMLLADSKWCDSGLDGRSEAIETLREIGYEVGSAGKKGPYRTNRINRKEPTPSRAYSLQRQAEREDVRELSHQDRLHISNRLLYTRGWDGADKWFQSQFGDKYDQGITHKFLRDVATKYDDLPSPPT